MTDNPVARSASRAASIAPWLAQLGNTPVRVSGFTASRIPDLQTAETIGRMCRHVRDAWQHPVIAKAVHDADADVPRLVPSERAARVFQWIKSHVVFRDDPSDDELLIAPPALLSMSVPAGDCDDFSMLAASMLIAARVLCEFVTIAADGGDPSKFSHVYVRAFTERGPLDMDTSHGPYPGWNASMYGPVYRVRRWPMIGVGR